MVGLLTFPLSLLADRLGRVKSLDRHGRAVELRDAALQLADNYQQMLAGRLLVGVGEAAYGSVGIAVVVSVFPKRLRATLSAAFMAGGLAGQVLGVGIGGAVAAATAGAWRSWSSALPGCFLRVLIRWSFAAVAPGRANVLRSAQAGHLCQPRRLFAGRTLKCAYVGSGLQLFVAGALPAWLPTYFNRYYDLPVTRRASLAALFLAIWRGRDGSVRHVSDRLVRDGSQRACCSALLTASAAPCCITAAFSLGPGPRQLILLGAGMFLAAATAARPGAMVAAYAGRASRHGFRRSDAGQQCFGLAPGPIVTGWLADRIGLLGALQWLPLASMRGGRGLLRSRSRRARTEIGTARKSHEQFRACDTWATLSAASAPGLSRPSDCRRGRAWPPTIDRRTDHAVRAAARHRDELPGQE